ncbi:MAG: Gfo/Idh/MocA family protein [Stackebrandtia sp.]
MNLRVGIVGAGAIGVVHGEAVAAVDGLTVSAVADPNLDAAHGVARPHDARVYAGHRELLDRGEVDALIVNTPHAWHTDIVIDAAAAGAHVLVEKPMATSIADCDTMIDACRAAGVVLAVGHIQRFLPDKVAAKRALDTDEIGRVLMLSDRRGTDYRPGSRPDWFLNPDVSGGGAFINIGAHCVDRILWLADTRVHAVTATVVRPPDSIVETDALARLDLAGGRTAHIAVTGSGPPARHDELSIIGERGSMTVSPLTGTVLHRDGKSRILCEPAADALPTAFAAQLRDFARAVSDGAEPAVTGAHGRHVLACVLAVYTSADKATTVHLEPGHGQS